MRKRERALEFENKLLRERVQHWKDGYWRDAIVWFWPTPPPPPPRFHVVPGGLGRPPRIEESPPGLLASVPLRHLPPWGLIDVDGMRCPWGCSPDRWLTDEEGKAFLIEAQRLGA